MLCFSGLFFEGIGVSRLPASRRVLIEDDLNDDSFTRMDPEILADKAIRWNGPVHAVRF